jgi:hypothetical protein
MFMKALEQWLKTIGEKDFASARRHAENMVRTGDLLVIHPEFRRCFAKSYPDVDPREALLHLCEFLVCATDGRAQVLSDYVEENKQEPI